MHWVQRLRQAELLSLRHLRITKSKCGSCKIRTFYFVTPLTFLTGRRHALLSGYPRREEKRERVKLTQIDPGPSSVSQEERPKCTYFFLEEMRPQLNTRRVMVKVG